MASQKLRGVLLCEDKEHKRFFEKLVERWFGTRNFRVEFLGCSKGAGDAFVIGKYAGEVQLARRKRFEKYALVVAIDGDRAKLLKRIEQLDQALRDAGLAVRAKDEKIAILVPTRNVETWELWLCGFREVDEENDFKQQLKAAEEKGMVSPKLAVEAWFKPRSEKEKRLEATTLPSLTAGRLELRRLDSA